MKFIWQDSNSGKPSTSKMWTHIAYGVATYLVIKTVVDGDDWEMLLAYMSVVGSSEIAKRILSTRIHSQSEESSPPRITRQPRVKK